MAKWPLLSGEWLPSRYYRRAVVTSWHMVLADTRSRPVSPLRLTSPSFARCQCLLNKMYNVAPCVAALQLNSSPVITCYHPFTPYL